MAAAKDYMLYIILSPVGAYYESGLAPVTIYVESKYVRAVKGGTGHYKTGGNYAASLLAGEKAHEKGLCPSFVAGWEERTNMWKRLAP